MYCTGLSPRARGKRIDGLELIVPLGPIPASAGETSPKQNEQISTRAYPRERGGNSHR
ncbi:hypothetical protein NTGHW29_400010 [Candidatus Nitrotoga sp. HW29]|nr:hypothetical protein NTGHW29_400010 [Candidatus Nitrotoga sp. HW29]